MSKRSPSAMPSSSNRWRPGARTNRPHTVREDRDAASCAASAALFLPRAILVGSAPPPGHLEQMGQEERRHGLADDAPRLRLGHRGLDEDFHIPGRNLI